MRILLDECVDSHLTSHMTGVDVTTVAAHGWWQHLPKYDIAVVLLVAKTNRVVDLASLIPALIDALPRVAKGNVTTLGL